MITMDMDPGIQRYRMRNSKLYPKYTHVWAYICQQPMIVTKYIINE